jgi:hypothetical protein
MVQLIAALARVVSVKVGEWSSGLAPSGHLGRRWGSDGGRSAASGSVDWAAPVALPAMTVSGSRVSLWPAACGDDRRAVRRVHLPLPSVQAPHRGRVRDASRIQGRRLRVPASVVQRSHGVPQLGRVALNRLRQLDPRVAARGNEGSANEPTETTTRFRLGGVGVEHLGAAVGAEVEQAPRTHRGASRPGEPLLQRGVLREPRGSYTRRRRAPSPGDRHLGGLPRHGEG